MRCDALDRASVIGPADCLTREAGGERSTVQPRNDQSVRLATRLQVLAQPICNRHRLGFPALCDVGRISFAGLVNPFPARADHISLAQAQAQAQAEHHAHSGADPRRVRGGLVNGGEPRARGR